jgi:hypothetical protein
MGTARYSPVLFALVVGAAGAPAGAGDAPPPTFTLDHGRTLIVFPLEDSFPRPLADPHRAGFGLATVHVTGNDIPSAGDERFALKVGGRLGLLRLQEGARAWQLNVEGGFNGQFDITQSEDNIGWDGLYGLTLTTMLRPGLSLRVGALHNSAHVGDEYIERTGRLRLNYTREEAIAGLSWQIDPRWRTYGELAHGYVLRNEALQAPGRAQAGLEYEAPTHWWAGRLAWYAALDVSAMEERDWRADVGANVGFLTRVGERRWRLGIEYYDGRPAMGEFFQHTEQHLALGAWLDL